MAAPEPGATAPRMRWNRRPGLALLAAGLAALAAAGTPGCGSPRPAQGHKLVWRTLSRGLSSGLDRPRREVLRDQASYYRAWADHAADLARPALPPAVDFDREMVVLVALGAQPTGGYLVEVVDAELRGRTLRLLVSERRPGPGTMQIQIPTQPYSFIALPAMNARVEFRTVDEGLATGGRRKARPGEEGPPPPEPAPTRRVAPASPATPVQSPKGANP